MTLYGRVQNGMVVLDKGPTLAERTRVEVVPLRDEPGDPLAVVAAMEAEPHLAPEDVAELEQAIASGKRPAAPIDPFTGRAARVRGSVGGVD
jgi:hypothetical protein